MLTLRSQATRLSECEGFGRWGASELLLGVGDPSVVGELVGLIGVFLKRGGGGDTGVDMKWI